MERKEHITQIVFQAIDDLNQLSSDAKIERSLDTNLVGDLAKLDSLGLVNLIVAVEDKLQESFGVVITLASENAMSVDTSPFKNVQSLVDYIDALLKEKNK